MCSDFLSSIHYENSSPVFTNVVFGLRDCIFGMQPLWQWAFPLEPNEQVSKLLRTYLRMWRLVLLQLERSGFWRLRCRRRAQD
jgi:hypothetical protein